ncbi:hypothetical protein [Bradyrhizobium sp.]|uniref:hypothetical protein n=1 Tax=Bradyrhizobium sp. TaxID=376 RepID=UPI003C57E57E
MLLASWVAITALTLQPGPGSEIVAVAFPPWWDARHAIDAAASADAAVVRMTAVPSLLIVRPDGQDGLRRLRASGAWFAIDPQAVAACLGK